MTILSINVCWTCGKSLLGVETPEDTFFWCNKECYDKDDRYHGRRKTEEPEPEAQDEVDDKLLAKQERKRKIREALTEASKVQKKVVGKQNSPDQLPKKRKRGWPTTATTKQNPRPTKPSKPTRKSGLKKVEKTKTKKKRKATTK